MNDSSLKVPHPLELEILIEVETNLKKDLHDPFLTWKEQLELNQALKYIRKRIELVYSPKM